MRDDWYYIRESKPCGPLSLSELKELVDSGKVTASDLVWWGEITEWVKASLIESLFPRIDTSSLPSLPFIELMEDGSVDADQELPAELRAKAEHNSLQATFKLHKCQAYSNTFGSSRELKNTAEDGLEFINAALELDQQSSRYWNVKGLLLADGLSEYEQALTCFRRALELEPDSIVITQNIRNIEQRKNSWQGLFRTST